MKRLLLGGRELPVVRNPDVVVVRDEVEDVLFEIRARARDRVNLVLPDHLGEGEADLRGGHGPRHGQEHLAAARKEAVPGLGRVHDRRGVEVAEVVLHEGSDRHRAGA